MADNNITGFKKLIRYAENLAEYEKGIADGIIDENVFVIVLAEQCAKFKGKTFDWSGGGAETDSELSDTSENAVQNKTVTTALATKQDVISDLETIRSGAALGATALQEHQGISHLATKAELEEAEEVTSVVLHEHEGRILGLENELSANVATKEALTALRVELEQHILDNEEIIAAAFNDLNKQIKQNLS